MNQKHIDNARIFKALCDEKRLAILELLQRGEQCACVLIDQMGIGQSSLSYHMKILCESGIVEGRQDGKWTHYCLSGKGSAHAVQLLIQLTTPDTTQHSSCCD